MGNFNISYSARPEVIGYSQLNAGNYLVTGATGTIGNEISKFIANSPDSVVFAGVRNLHKFSESDLALKENIKPVMLGEDESELKAGLSSISVEIDGVIHCEGSYGELGELSQIDLDAWIENLSVSLKRAITLMNWMNSQSNSKQTAAIFLGGGGASEAYSGLSNYNLMKTSLVRLVETAALEVNLDRLSLNVLGPGPTDSNMVDRILNSNVKIDERIVKASFQLREDSRKVSDKVFRAISFLFSEEGRRITGRFFSADWDNFSQLDTSDLSSFKLRRVIPG